VALRRSLCLAAVGLAGLVVLLGLANCPRHEVNVQRIGVPEGAAGLLVSYVLQEKMALSGMQAVRYEQQILYDCCAATSQYALGSGHLDLAIMCPDAALALVESDQRFEIVGPVLVNGDVFVLASGHDLPVAVGISQKRENQRQMVRERFGERCVMIPMLHAVVPFVFARHEIDGVVVDITRALNLSGTLLPGSDSDRVTAVLVARSSSTTGDLYRQFLHNYEEAVRETAQPATLLRLLQSYLSANIGTGDMQVWQQMNVHFVSPSGSRQPE